MGRSFVESLGEWTVRQSDRLSSETPYRARRRLRKGAGNPASKDPQWNRWRCGHSQWCSLPQKNWTTVGAAGPSWVR